MLCMYVCMYVCIHSCINVCMYVCMYVWICLVVLHLQLLEHGDLPKRKKEKEKVNALVNAKSERQRPHTCAE